MVETVLCRKKQLTIGFNKYEGIFENVISSDNMWKRMKEEMDFSFIYDIIGDNYSSTNGRPVKDIIVMFKLLLLKASFSKRKINSGFKKIKKENNENV